MTHRLEEILIDPASEQDNTYQAAEAVLQRLVLGLSPFPCGPSPATDATLLAKEAPADGTQHIETKLRMVEARYRALVEQLPIVTFVAALDGGVNELYVSPQIQALLGFSQKEWLENPVLWYTQLHPEDRERWHREFARTCAVGERFRSEYRFLARDGRVVWVHGEAQMVRDELGRPLFLQGMAYDITERKRAEEALLAINVELEKRVRERTTQLEQALATLARQAGELARTNAELEQFTYVASHDLHEPLRTVANFTHLLAERYRGQLDADADDFVAYIIDAAARMQNLLHDLLTYSHLGRTGNKIAPTDCMEVLANVCANLRKNIEDSGGFVRIEPLPTIAADKSQLMQVFQNLIGNALKFHKENEPPRIQVGSRRQGHEWLFWVRDHGIGVEPQYSERIFRIFQRLHHRKDYAGTGIGLAICKKAIEGQGGRIWIESEPGQGSVFYFTLPAREDEDRTD